MLAFEKDVLKLICGYARQCGRNVKKQSFYELRNEWDMHSVDGLVVCSIDLNEHVSRHIDGVCGVPCKSEEFGRKNVIRAFT